MTHDEVHELTKQFKRIADALQRIAEAQEQQQAQPPADPYGGYYPEGLPPSPWMSIRPPGVSRAQWRTDSG